MTEEQEEEFLERLAALQSEGKETTTLELTKEELQLIYDAVVFYAF